MRRLIGVAAAALCVACGSSRDATPVAPSGAGARVLLEYRAPTARRGELLATVEGCVLGAGATHAHASWQAFAARVMTPVPPGRFETTFDDVPVDSLVSFRVNDGNNCDQNPTGAATRSVFVNGVELVQNTLTPGSGLEPGFAFTISATGRIAQ
jgi:hypothetical protein